MKVTRSLSLLCIVLFAVSGCSTVNDHLSFEMGSQPLVYVDQWTRRDAPVVYVYPKDAAGMDPSVFFVPFRVTQKITNPEMIGYAEARSVYQTWLSMEIFSTMEFAPEQGPYRRDRALAMARARGADLLVGGFVTYYLAGGSTTESQLAIQVEMYDTASGELVCSMAQSALMPARETKDYLLFATKTRLPGDPMQAMTRTMAEDMGKLLRGWFGSGSSDGSGGDTRQGRVETRQNIRPSF
ncbi:hypothetical protein LJC23_06335 [Desulfovibrio sp. OttesenSCG-928-I05]|nr:hypothetical protein [Desulfovibrio sp. OttesenSCG-928-I05]